MTDLDTALAMTAATTIVTAMATSAWEATRTGVARIFGRDADGDPEAQAGSDVVVRLERSARRIAEAPDPEEARQRQISRWQEDLEDLLHDHPDAAPALRALVEAVRQQLPQAPPTQWSQQVVARDGGLAAGAIGPNSSVVVHRDRETPPAGDAR
ncbi:hypothetical protein ACIQY8_22900 [Streptomyces albidoflavus]